MIGTNSDPTVHADLSLVFEIAFVGDDDDGEGVLVFDAEDLLVEGAYFLERVAGCDGVDEKETLACAHVLLAHGTASHVNLALKVNERTPWHTRILPDQLCPEHQAAPLRHQSRIAFGTSLSAVVRDKVDSVARRDTPSMVGSYSSTKWLWINWIVRADFPTPGVV